MESTRSDIKKALKVRSISNDNSQPAKTTVRRALTRQLPKPKLAGSTDANQLVIELGKLNVNDAKGKQKAQEPAVDPKLLSMRGVNAASQSLSAVVQSGWKKSTADGTRTTLTTVNNATASAAKHLSILRKLAPGDTDVERAAVSVLGKLVALEMFEHASSFLVEIHARLCALSDVTNEVTSHLGIPLHPTDPTILNLISTYLGYAIIIKSYANKDISKTVQELAAELSASSTHSLLVWLPSFSVLPTKHVDSLLTRTYTALNKLSSTAQTPSSSVAGTTKSKSTSIPAEEIFTVRMYGMQCLALTSPGVVEASVFWDQCNRYGSTLVKATPPASEERATQMLLSAYSKIVQLVEKRHDKDVYLSSGEDGKRFVAFCEHWTGFAKRSGDITLLRKINSLMHHPSSSSLSPSLPQQISTEPASPNQEILLEGTKVYNALGQLSIFLESSSQSDNRSALCTSLQYVTCLFKTSQAVSVLLQPVSQGAEKRSREEAELIRISGKVDRAFEKARRAALKLLEASSSMVDVDSDLRNFLLQAVTSLEQYLSVPTTNAAQTRDILTRSLDTIFVLSRTQLNPTNPTTFVPAFDLLSRATCLLGSVPHDKFPLSPIEDTVDIANYTRCVSGAFYNLAGSLYQATRYGNAVPFLVESCTLGEKALRIPIPETAAPNPSRELEWAQLRDTLFRRWELLAVCYSKNGDRKNAYECFKRSIHSFPFESAEIMAQCDKLPLEVVFGASGNSLNKHLAGLVEKSTYLGACDLLLSPEDISIAGEVTSPTSVSPTSLEASVAGALLEQQLDSLEPSRWKDGMRDIFIRLLRDALDVYGNTMPIRRARVLIRCMSFAYRDHNTDTYKLLGFEDAVEMGEQIEGLATLDSYSRDSALAHFIPQYRIMAHLWLALHAHRYADPSQNMIMTQRVEAACRLMKAMLVHGSDSTSPKATRKGLSPKVVAKVLSPKIARVGKLVSPRPTRSTRLRTPAAPKKALPAKTTRSRTAKATAGPVTPKAPSRAALPPVVAFKSAQTPPRQSTGGANGGKPALLFDDFEKFLALLQLTSRILGMLALILPKAHLLEMARKLAQRQLGPTSDGYVIASLDLAHEYATLGRLRRATSIFTQALDIVRSGQASAEIAVRFLLRFSESLALIEDVPQSCKFYLEALELSKELSLEENAKSTQQRIHARTSVLEIAATATYVFALVQYAKGDINTSLEGFLQSLRLWNRAVDTLARLNPSPKSTTVPADSDPFQMSGLKDALPSIEPTPSPTDQKVSNKRLPMDGVEWRISEGLLSTMLSLAHAYFLRGSAREAEYFSREAAELAEQLNAPAIMSRALAKQGKVQLHMGRMEEAQASLTKAAELVSDHQSLEAAEIRSVFVDLRACMAETEAADEPQKLLDETLSILEDLDGAFRQFDNLTFGPRRSLSTSPRSAGSLEVLAPEVLCSILCQQLWTMRDEPGDAFNALLQKLISISHSTSTKAEENAIMAKLTLHGVYDRFRTDMFLSSLTESTIAVPVGMGSKQDIRTLLSSVEVVDALADAERLLWEHLHLTSTNGNVVKIREVAISLVLVSAFRTSLGDKRTDRSLVMAGLLDISAALTLRRDMLEAIAHKIIRQAPDDLQWPIMSETGDCMPSPRPSSNTSKGRRFAMASLSDSDEECDGGIKPEVLKNYWNCVREKYQKKILNPSVLCASETEDLPDNWTIVNISVTPDKDTLFISRQEGGSQSSDPLIFSIPLKGRRDHSSGEDDNHLTFEDAIQEFNDIVQSSDQCTKSAINIKADDEEARSNWWKERGSLDVRMRELLENIEYCWLGAFKTILSPPSKMPAESVVELCGQIEKVFHRSLHVKDTKKARTKPSSNKKSISQQQTTTPTDFTLDDSIVKCFSTLPPKCRDEELEDFIYFVLDLYQFHGVPVAIAEVDVDQVVIDLRTVLEEHRVKESKRKTSLDPPPQATDEHLFLILDKNVQGLPWESMPILRGRSVSRIPGVQFLHDRLAFARMKREAAGVESDGKGGAFVDPRNGYYILNPSGDLGRTEERFRDWSNAMKKSGWGGITGTKVSEQQFIDALTTRDLVVYFGHGGGEQYVRSHKVRSLPSCAATMLWGCSSGNLRDMGDFDRTGTPYNYMLGGCPTLVANLWDVTDKDIDKLSQAVLDKIGLGGTQTRERSPRSATSLVAAVAQSRDSCKLKYLTGAAPVVYGIPFYL